MINVRAWVSWVFGNVNRLLGLVVLCAACFWAAACSSGEFPSGGGAIGTISDELRTGLTACSNDTPCSPQGLVCCAGYCATPANTSTTKLAFGTGTTVGYKCFANRATSLLPNPPLNILPDFSFAGYQRGGVPIPTAASFGTMLTPSGGDDTLQIQARIDQVGDWVAANGGTRAVLLGPGKFKLSQPLWIRKSGVVLRGMGQAREQDGGTVLYSTKAVSHELIRVKPHADGDIDDDDLPSYPIVQKHPTLGSSFQAGIATTAVPVGATRFTLGLLPTGMTLNFGDSIAVVRTPTEQWLNDVSAPPSYSGWREAATDAQGNEKPCTTSSQCASTELCDGEKCLRPIPAWHVRTVVSFDPNTRVLDIDIPIVDAIYSAYGGGYVAKILPKCTGPCSDGDCSDECSRFIERAGVEDLRIDAQFTDTYPQVCTNGAGAADDEFCECKNDGEECTTASNCGPGYACQTEPCEDDPQATCKVCRCPCTNNNNSCVGPGDCSAGQVCRDGICVCGAQGRCDSGAACVGDDGNWTAIGLRRAQNSWVRGVTVEKFGYSAVLVSDWSSFNTIEEVAHYEPQSPLEPGEICDISSCSTCESNAGNPKSSHRYSFNVGSGIGNLFQRLYAKRARHTFVTGSRSTGPHVWLDSVGEEQLSDIGPHQRWATGLLFDNVHTVNPDPLIACRWGEGQGVNVRYATGGHGWRGANVMLWNNDAPVQSYAPPAAQNWVVGGIATPPTQPAEDPFGIWEFTDTTVKPRSLYLQQLTARLGSTAANGVVSQPQQSRRIWDDLVRWKGEGKLSSYYADPNCDNGIKDDTTGACCDPDCGVCGTGSGLSSECRTDLIMGGSRSCLETGAPCYRVDPECDDNWSRPSSNGLYCCPKSSCSQCGGSGCPSGCCVGNVTRSCAEHPALCKVADPTCKAGVEGGGACCPSSCAQCGGPGCSGAGTNCCIGTIQGLNRDCDGDVAPCVLGEPLSESAGDGGVEEGDEFGGAIATGNFNNDAYTDLVVGAPGEDSGAGGIFVFMGSAAGIDQGFWIKQSSVSGGTNEAGDRFGSAIATGDLNNDNFDDLVVGVPGKDSDAGILFVWLGSSSGITPSTGRKFNSGHFNCTNKEAGDDFGAALSIGDFNADGFDDLAVGAPGEDNDTGSVCVIKGRVTTGISNGSAASYNQSTAGGGPQAGDRFGVSLARGKLTNGAHMDLAIGSSGEDSGAGAVFVFYGSGSSATGAGSFFTTGTWRKQNSALGTDDLGDGNGDVEADDRFGKAIAVADLNDDGFDDLVVGAPEESLSGDKGGNFAVYNGGSGGPAASGLLYSQNSSVPGAGTEDGDLFGLAFATGDFDGNGKIDLAVGSPGESPGAEPDEAGMIVIFGGGSSPLVPGFYYTQEDFRDNSELGDLMGAALAAGNFNGDSFADLAIGAPGEVTDQDRAGYVYLR